MNTDVQKILQERIVLIPQDLRDALYDPTLEKRITSIGISHGLNSTACTRLANEVALAFLGIIRLDRFVDALVRELSLPPEVAQAVTEDIDEHIFAPFEDGFYEMYGIEGEIEHQDLTRLHLSHTDTEDEDVSPATNHGVHVTEKKSAPLKKIIPEKEKDSGIPDDPYLEATD